MKLHEAIRKTGLVHLLTLASVTWVSMGIKSDDINTLLAIKADYVVRDKRKPVIISTWLDAIDAADIPSESCEHVVLLCTDHDDRMILREVIAIGSRDKVSVCKQRIYELTSSIRAVKAYLLHNHPRGGASGINATVPDVKFTIEVRDILATMQCKLMAHLVVDRDSADDVLTGDTVRLRPCSSYTDYAGTSVCSACGHSKEEHDDWIQQAESELNE